ncbi:MAG TPA: PEP-CTERM sorting domain-containing protein [Terracidiphilus sp.]
MHKLRSLAVAIAALACVSVASANSIVINAGESPTFPPTFTTLASGPSPLVLNATVCCGPGSSFLVSASAVGTPPLPSGQLDTSTIDISTSGPGTLFLWITETGLTSPFGNISFLSGLTANLIQGAITNVTLSTFVDKTNGTGPPTGTLLDTNAFSAIGTQSSTNTVAVGAGPYSIEALYTIVATGVGNANLTIDVAAAAAPEPTTYVLFGSALVLLALLRRYRPA